MSDIDQIEPENLSTGVRTKAVPDDYEGDPPHEAPKLDAATEKRLQEAQKKPKRQLSEKQLANLAKAREKARIVNKERNAAKRQLKADEKKVKQLREKKRHDEVRAELEIMQGNDPEPEPAPAPKKAKAKKKKRVVYYESSSSSSESEVEYVKRPRRKPAVPARPVAEPKVVEPQGPTQAEMEERALEHEYQEKLRRMKRKVIMDSVFPMG